MKKLAALLISVVLLLVSGCGKQETGADEKRADPLPPEDRRRYSGCRSRIVEAKREKKEERRERERA